MANLGNGNPPLSALRLELFASAAPLFTDRALIVAYQSAQFAAKASGDWSLVEAMRAEMVRRGLRA